MQTYTLTFNFTLRNPSDYKHARDQLERAIKEIPWLTGLNIQIDYIAIEQKEEVSDG